MRGLGLARIAARAEWLRLRLFARRQARRAALAAVAAVFLVAALAVLHVAGAMALACVVRPIWAALIVAGIDVVIAAIFALLASRDRPGPAEREALQVRMVAQEEVLATVSLATLLARYLRRR